MFLPFLTAPVPHMVRCVLAQSRRETYRGGVSSGGSGGTPPGGEASPDCVALGLAVSEVGVVASVPSSPTSTSVALCWPPGGTSIWILLGSLAAAAPSRVTSK